MNRKPRSINTGDDIKARLRDWPSWVSEESATTIVHLAREAADHIEALEANQCPGDCTTYRTSLLTRAKTLETENQKLAYAALKAEAEVERLRDWIQDIANTSDNVDEDYWPRRGYWLPYEAREILEPTND